MSAAGWTVVAAVSRTPPVTGQGIAGDMLLAGLRTAGIPTVEVPLSRGNRYRMGALARIQRTFSIAGLYGTVRSACVATPRAVFYLHLGQSSQAFLRDLVLLSAARQRGIPQVVHVHGGGFRHAFDNAPLWVRNRLRHALADVESAIVLTPRLREMFAGLVPADRVAVVSNGIDQGVWQSAAPPRPRAPGEPLRVLFLGNLIPTKGYPAVLEAARIAAAGDLNVEFTLAGDRLDPDDPSPHTFIEQHGLRNVRLVGAVEGAAKEHELARAHVFIMPTRYPVEGQPLAILEALHFGLPVIATDAGGIADVVIDHRTGWLVQDADPVALVRVIEQALSDDAARVALGASAQATARSAYTGDAHVACLTALLAQAAGGAA